MRATGGPQRTTHDRFFGLKMANPQSPRFNTVTWSCRRPRVRCTTTGQQSAKTLTNQLKCVNCFDLGWPSNKQHWRSHNRENCSTMKHLWWILAQMAKQQCAATPPPFLSHRLRNSNGIRINSMDGLDVRCLLYSKSHCWNPNLSLQ